MGCVDMRMQSLMSDHPLLPRYARAAIQNIWPQISMKLWCLLVRLLGRVDKVRQPHPNGGKVEEACEGYSGLVVTGRNTAELLEEAEYLLDCDYDPDSGKS